MVTRRVVVARLLMLLMEMKALASRMAIDLRVVYIVDNGKIRILSGQTIWGGWVASLVDLDQQQEEPHDYQRIGQEALLDLPVHQFV